MRLAIDGSNIRDGGGVTHLTELLRVAQPQEYGFDKVLLWGGASALRRIEDRPWLYKVHEPLLDRTLSARLFWQQFVLHRLARSAECSLLFVPGGSYGGRFRPFVTMSQNMLPFEKGEACRYGFSITRLRLMLLRWAQSRTFRDADGLIFLTPYAWNGVMQVTKRRWGKMVIVPHGVDARFQCHPRRQEDLRHYSQGKPYRILYVSIVAPYKHQWHVVEAVTQLRQKGFPLRLELIGPAHLRAMGCLRKAMEKCDPQGRFVHYHGPVPYAELPSHYHRADAFVFASSCENLPIILLEAMAAGLPIACSNRGPMPEVAGNAVIYFDPEDPVHIANALEQLVSDPALRATKAQMAFARASLYSWDRCAQETFGFLARIANTGSSVDSLRI